ncbi:Heme oxygenase [Corynebacterium ciconiae DSM 44920]|uniref:biliverdin-producing heme oxygenase n=1 Tax=Corynebacterium ciconiae TaxID=227319 RepID=UPI000382C613|nr:biliverdin-producing heme oxygenase [Corynebacterium ciconiae]WKD60458.1 Heme oxygenase [Corynebacterium ciconiae DSM 44920]
MTASVAEPLSVALKASTAQAHDLAENAEFIKKVVGGELDVSAYTALLEQTYQFYAALESMSRGLQNDPIFALIYDETLMRLPQLRQDLRALHGSDDWRENLTMLPATARYCVRLAEIGALADGPAALAHHYVRYLGDLSGGQVIAVMLKRHYGVDENALNFYRFLGIDKPKKYKDSYREKLDNLKLTDEQRERVLDEAGRAFRHNMEVFGDLKELTGI